MQALNFNSVSLTKVLPKLFQNHCHFYTVFHFQGLKGNGTTD